MFQPRNFAMARLARSGEPWLTFFDPDELADALRAVGYRAVDVLAPAGANDAYFASRVDGLRISGSGRMMVAQV